MENNIRPGEAIDEDMKKPKRTTIEVQFDTEADVQEFKRFCVSRGYTYAGFAKSAIHTAMNRTVKAGL
jgi:hypothetical protein